jgi:hypothetical protein
MTKKYNFERFFSLIVIFAILVTLIPLQHSSASAAYNTNDEVTVTITLNTGGKLTRPAGTSFYIKYDTTLFSYVVDSLTFLNNSQADVTTLAVTGSADISLSSGAEGTGTQIKFVPVTKVDVTTETVALFSLKLKYIGSEPLEDTGTLITSKCTQEANGVATATYSAPEGGGGDAPPPAPLPEAAPYTVSLAPSTAAPDLNATDFTVDAKVSSTVEGAEFASFEADFTYNATAFVYDITTVLPEGVLVTIPETPNGTGHISRLGTAVSLTTPATVATLKFKPIGATEGSTFEFDEESILLTASGVPGVPLANVAADPEPLEVTVTVGPTFLAPNTNFTDGFTLITYVASTNPTNGFNYNGQPMWYASKLGEANEFYYQILIPGVATANGTVSPGTAPHNLTYDGNLNNNTATIDNTISAISRVNIIDAQIAFDLIKAHMHGNYSGDSTFTVLSMQDRLEADVNGDGVLDISDANAIQYKSHHGHFTWEE